MNHNEEMKKMEDHEGQMYISFDNLEAIDDRHYREYMRADREEVEKVGLPEMRKWFFRTEGWYADDDIIIQTYNNRFKPVEEPEKQVGGSHYIDMKITPTEYIIANNINWCEANVIKYISRHGSKNGREDVEKALHYCELILETYDEAERLESLTN